MLAFIVLHTFKTTIVWTDGNAKCDGTLMFVCFDQESSQAR